MFTVGSSNNNGAAHSSTPHSLQPPNLFKNNFSSDIEVIMDSSSPAEAYSPSPPWYIPSTTGKSGKNQIDFFDTVSTVNSDTSNNEPTDTPQLSTVSSNTFATVNPISATRLLLPPIPVATTVTPGPTHLPVRQTTRRTIHSQDPTDVQPPQDSSQYATAEKTINKYWDASFSKPKLP